MKTYSLIDYFDVLSNGDGTWEEICESLDEDTEVISIDGCFLKYED